MNKWAYLIQIMRKGVIVADPAAWKNRQILVSAFAGIVAAGYAFCKAMGWIDVEIATADLMELGTALGAVLFMGYNIVSTVASTDKVGLPGPDPAAGVLQSSEPAPGNTLPADAVRGTGSSEGNGRNPFLES